MSGALSDNLMDDGFANTQAIHGQRVTIDSGADAGKVFIATMLTMPDVEFDGEVVADSREKVVCHFSNNSFPNVKPEDTMVDSSGVKWRFIGRTNNPVDNSVDFEVMKVVPGKN